MTPGISVIICCYNSATRLPETLKHLAAQHCPELNWELLIIDNASSDATSVEAATLWKQFGSTVPMRVIPEPMAGLSHARNKGVEEARYELILFCDDDNHFAPDYLQRAYKILEEKPEVGILGGLSKPELAFYPGKWIEDMYPAMAIGAIAPADGYVEWVYGAGMVVRKKIFKELKDKHIHFLLSDRKGNTQTFGGDAELCELTKFLGYKIYYSSTLSFFHYMQQHRLKKSFFLKGYTAILPSVYLYQISDVVKHKNNSLPADDLYALMLKQKFQHVLHFLPRQFIGRHKFYSRLSFYQSWLLCLWLLRHKNTFSNIHSEVMQNLGLSSHNKKI